MQQLSLLELARRQQPGLDDGDRVAALAADIVETLRLKPPVDARVVAAYQGINEIRVESTPWAGSLFGRDGAFIIQVRASDSRRRRRFSALHEVGHTLLPGWSIAPQFRCETGVSEARSIEESLSDIAASEFLFPRNPFARDLIGSQFGLESISELADRYDASLEATANRFVDLWPADVLLVVLERMSKLTERRVMRAQVRFRVRYARAKGDWPYVPKFKSIRDASLLSETVLGGGGRGISSLDELVPGNHERLEFSVAPTWFTGVGGNHRERALVLFRRRRSNT
jgi:Zn-dependent peptidase ImmA (M78 family)